MPKPLLILDVDETPIDDSPEKLSQHYGNHIRVRPFTGDPADDEMSRLLPFIEQLATVENFRTVEKRDWRQRTPAADPRAAIEQER